ncbi:MAG: hypothetical protein KFF73_00865 [Cyclobacteriaceae bacterium]|nr:hypothetical protein [Cyclobacteriaceae bacterium]
MIPILKYIISVSWFLVMVQSAFSQGSKYIPSQFKLGTDLTYIGASLVSGEKIQNEFNADIDFNRFLIAGDYGFGSWIIDETDYGYENSGNYVRIGFDYNFIKPDPDNNAIYIGLRYAGTRFTENFTFRMEDPLYGSYTNEIAEVDRSGMWLEFVTGMKVRIWKGIFLGWTGRFKFASGVSSQPSSFATFWIPGFGKNSQDSHWGLNYQIFYSIPLFKKNGSLHLKPSIQ